MKDDMTPEELKAFRERLHAEVEELDETMVRLHDHPAVGWMQDFVQDLDATEDVTPDMVIALLQVALAHYVKMYRGYFDDIADDEFLSHVMGYRLMCLVYSSLEVAEEERKEMN